MSWWNWALILWATGATAGVVYLGCALSMRVEWAEECHRESGDLWGVLDQDAERLGATGTRTADVRMPLVLLARLRHAASLRSR